MSKTENKIEASDKTISELLKDKKFFIDYFQREYRYDIRSWIIIYNCKVCMCVQMKWNDELNHHFRLLRFIKIILSLSSIMDIELQMNNYINRINYNEYQYIDIYITTKSKYIISYIYICMYVCI